MERLQRPRNGQILAGAGKCREVDVCEFSAGGEGAAGDVGVVELSLSVV